MVDVFKAFYFCIWIYGSSTWNDVILSIVSEKILHSTTKWLEGSTSRGKAWAHHKKKDDSTPKNGLIILKVWFLFLTDIFILAYSNHKIVCFFPQQVCSYHQNCLPDHESKITALTLPETNELPMKIPIFPGKYHQNGGPFSSQRTVSLQGG